MASSNWTDPGSSFGVASALFALTALPAGILFGAISGDFEKGMIFGFLFGLIFAICMIPFMRTKRATLHFDNRASFEQRLMVEMAALMYTPIVINENLLHYDAPQNGVMEIGPLKNMSAAHLNRISVHFDGTSATLIGPRWMVSKVLAKLGGSSTLTPNTATQPDPHQRSSPGNRAGWYRDPTQRFEVRFWDGTQWTNHVMSHGNPAIDRFS